MSQNPQILYVLELHVQDNALSLLAAGFDQSRLKGLGAVITGADSQYSGYTLIELHERDGLWMSDEMLSTVEQA